MLKNSVSGYGVITKTFHWLMGMTVITLLAVGVYMTGLENSPFKFQVYGIHKAVGICVLTAVILRLIWHRISPKPGFEATLKPWEKNLAHVIHTLLYVAMIGMPLSGWAMSSAANFPVSVFGLFTLPPLLAPNKELVDLFKLIHGTAGNILIGIVGLHVAGALKHALIDKDGTLRRMLPVMVIALLLPMTAQAAVPQWNIIAENSSIAFTWKQSATPATGTFEKFSAAIFFDPDNLAGSTVSVDIDLAALKTGYDDRDRDLKGGSWFDIATFPAARFVSTTFHQKADGSYEVDGNLTIRNISIPVTLPFTLTFSNNASGHKTAQMSGTLTLDRLQFGLGQGEWSKTDVIANDVVVDIRLVALQETP